MVLWRCSNGKISQAERSPLNARLPPSRLTRSRASLVAESVGLLPRVPGRHDVAVGVSMAVFNQIQLVQGDLTKKKMPKLGKIRHGVIVGLKWVKGNDHISGFVRK